MRRTAVVGLATLVLVGCGGGQSAVTRGDYTIYVHGGSLLARGGEGALVEGVLVGRDGCVLLEQEGFDIAYPVIWPAGTSIVNEDPLALELPSGEELTIGQTVRGGGGYHDVSSDSVEVDIPAACVPETDEVAVFNPDADPQVID